MKPADEMKRLFADLPEAIANTLVVAQRCAFAAPKRKPILPSLAGDRRARRRSCASDARAGLEARLAKAGIYRPPSGRREYVDRLDVRDRRHHPDGLPRLFPDRCRLHQMGQGARYPGGAGARFGRGLAWSPGR